jgi:hypothetical protein
MNGFDDIPVTPTRQKKENTTGFDDIEVTSTEKPVQTIGGQPLLQRMAQETIGHGRLFLQAATANTYSEGVSFIEQQIYDAVPSLKPEYYKGLTGEELRKELVRVKQEQDKTLRSSATGTVAELGGGFFSPTNKINAATTVGRVAQAGLEGTVAGYFAEDVDERGATAALEGTLFGTVFGTLGEAFSWLVNGATSRKVAEELQSSDPNKPFKPLTLAVDEADPQESIIGQVYRSVIYPSLGARSAIKNQELSYENYYRKLAEKDKLELNKYVYKAEKAKEDIKNSVNKRIKTYKDKTADELSTLNIELDEKLKTDINDLSTSAEANIRKQEDDFRQLIFSNSIPSDISPETMEAIAKSANPQEAFIHLDEAWKKQGFSSLKDIKFRIKKDSFSLESFEDELMEVDPKVRRGILPDIKAAVADIEANTVDGFIKSEDLTRIRTMLRSSVNKLGDSGDDMRTRKAYEIVTDRVENIIRGRLRQEQARQIARAKNQGASKDEIQKIVANSRLSRYEKDLENYRVSRVLEEAIALQSKKASQDGFFGADDWVTALGKSKFRTKGIATFQPEAKVLDKQIQKEGAIQDDLAESLNKAVETEKAYLSSLTKKKVDREVERLQKRIDAIKNSSTRTIGDMEELAQSTKRIDQLTLMSQQSEKVLSDIRQRMSPDNISWFNTMFTTGLLGGVTSGAATGDPILSAIATLPAGMAVADRTSTKNFQNFVAGQTGWQKATQESLARGANQTMQDLFGVQTNRELLNQVSPAIARTLNQQVLTEEN